MTSPDMPRGTLALVVLLTAGAVIGSAIVITAGGEEPALRTVGGPVGLRPAGETHPAQQFEWTQEGRPLMDLPAPPLPAEGAAAPQAGTFHALPPAPGALSKLPLALPMPQLDPLPEDPAERVRVIKERLEGIDLRVNQARDELRTSVAETRAQARRKLGLLLRERTAWVRRAQAEGLEVRAFTPAELKGLRLRSLDEE